MITVIDTNDHTSFFATHTWLVTKVNELLKCAAKKGMHEIPGLTILSKPKCKGW